MKVQILDDVRGRFNSVGEVITVMRENNINRSDISTIEVSTKLKENLISVSMKRLQSYKKIKDICNI